MKRLVLIASLLIITIGCERERDSSIVGIWDYAGYSYDGGATWDKVGDYSYDFRDDGEMIQSISGLTYEFHYNVCSRNNLIKYRLKDSTSYSLVNENCDCTDTNTFAMLYEISADTMEINGLCLPSNDTLVKLYRR
jgi:hypothetical protein